MKKNISILFIFIILCTVFVACSYTPPDDLAMQQIFDKNKSVFMELAQMKKKDSQVEWIHRSNNTSRPASINQARWNKYMELMNKINIKSLLSKENSVMFYPDQPMRSTLYEKGYIYSVLKLEPVYEVLDKEQSNAKPYSTIYKKIDDNWYLFFINLNG
ncbi:MAG: hypothetical protein JXR78_07540 [Victivallales bacterium]|nr:hypothetical protein [Victivallales bacterium]